MDRKERLAHYREQVVLAKQQLEMFESGLHKQGEIDSAGRVNDLTADAIKHEKLVIANLEAIIAFIEAQG